MGEHRAGRKVAVVAVLVFGDGTAHAVNVKVVEGVVKVGEFGRDVVFEKWMTRAGGWCGLR